MTKNKKKSATLKSKFAPWLTAFSIKRMGFWWASAEAGMCESLISPVWQKPQVTVTQDNLTGGEAAWKESMEKEHRHTKPSYNLLRKNKTKQNFLKIVVYVKSQGLHHLLSRE